MPSSLIKSQLETLEPLEADELGKVLDLTAPVTDIVADFMASLNLTGDHQ